MTGLFTEVPGETVRKGILREWLGRVPSMRRAYQTDLSDEEWSYIEPHLPTPKAPGRPRVHTLREISSTPSSTSCVVAVPGDCCPTTSHPGRPSTITSERGGSTALGRGCTPPAQAPAGLCMKRDPQPSAGVVDRASRSRAPVWEGIGEVRTEERRGKAESAI